MSGRYATRAERRAAARELAKTLTRQPRQGKGRRWDIILGLIGIGLTIVLSFLPPQTKAAALLWLIGLFSVFAYPVAQLTDSFLGNENECARAVAIVVLACIIAVFGTVVWPRSKRHQLSVEEEATFQAALGTPSKTVKQTIQFACPTDDEKACVFASQFIPLFGKSGWDVENAVERVTLQRPQDGVVLVERGGKQQDLQSWNFGGWTALTPDVRQIYEAFTAIGITPDSSAGPLVKDGVIVVWVGEERQDESSRTGLTKALDTLERSTHAH